ncbi:hypothetical protein [Methylocaldum marinum]|uniref:hypothetical protein n=1 Tax=Methylocaldum marinum TaxID=1432792 RepID=UPI0038CC170A
MKIPQRRAARLTLLMDPDKKATFERLCTDEVLSARKWFGSRLRCRAFRPARSRLTAGPELVAKFLRRQGSAPGEEVRDRRESE